ncbi:nucleoside monophosphate kinase [Candidatus Dojkabacteria bacterium]|nr:nucleoside monophosphate kinase [Candidatus Dojkabacteria bacterium]
MIIIILGPSGSGKDTQADLISRKYGFSVCGTGDLFRHEIEKGTKLGKIAEGYIKKGIWVPIRYWEQVVKNWISRTDLSKNHLLVGFIRIDGQQQILDKLLANAKSRVDLVIHVTLSDQEAIKRLSCRWFCKTCGETYDDVHKPPKVKGICDKDGSKLIKREDDKPQSIRHRMSDYNKNIHPIISYYREHGVLEEVDGAPSIPKVFKAISKILTKNNEKA